ncbi:MAG: hypothetical protein CMH22_05970 [Methylophaga sp.]|nr:hypothetical protein [Methylophaga sp.]|tara:strand:+ start:65438 stop:65818 length:381 start_codon:yes stop_codon:yes gene_type:complete
MTTKQKYIELIRKSPITETASFQLNNLDMAKLVKTKRGLEVENEHGTQYALEQLELNEVLLFCYDLNIEPRMDYLIMSDDNQWLGTGKFATQAEIDTHIEDILGDYDEDRLELVVFTAEEMKSFNI